MKEMQKSAKLVLTSYNLDTINTSLAVILAQAVKMRVSVEGTPVSSKVVFSNDDTPIWGCKRSDVKRKSVFVSGSVQDLKKLIKIKTAEGVYVQLLPKEND